MSEPNSIYVSARLSAATEAAQVGDVARSTEDLDWLIRAVVPSTRVTLGGRQIHSAQTSLDSEYSETGRTSARLAQHLTSGPREMSPRFGDDYFDLWRSGGPTHSILSNIRDRLSECVEEKLLRLEDHTDINILNGNGDARITRNFLAANIGHQNIYGTRDKIGFEYPPLSFSAYAYDQSDGRCLTIKPSSEPKCFRDTEIIFARPIEPLGTAAYAIEYSVSGMFRFDTFWFSRVYAGLIRQSLSIRLSENTQVRHYATISELPTGEVLEWFPKIRIEASSTGSLLHWEMKFPTCESLVKTFWRSS